MAISTIGTASISGLGYGFKNRIINGAMVIDQRNAGAAQTITAGSAPYTLDRFGLYCAGANQTSQQVSATASGFQYGLQITGAASASIATLFQRIESKNIADCAGQTVTLSFKVYNSGSSTTMLMQPYYPNATDNYSSTTNFLGSTLTLPNGWSTQTYTFVADSNCTKGLGLDFQFGALGAGVTRIITGVQLEAGTVATTFDYRPYGTELALCQRYYHRLTGSSGASGYQGICIGQVGGATSANLMVKLPVSMRATPTTGYGGTVTIYDTSASPSITSIGTTYLGNDTLFVAVNASGGGLTTARCCSVYTGNASTNYMDFSSEL